jgi:hypothetical protein
MQTLMATDNPLVETTVAGFDYSSTNSNINTASLKLDLAPLFL